MNKLSPSKLQLCLDRLSSYTTKAYIQRDLLSKHCQEVYGCDPADVDNDEFIDLCDGGCGKAEGMSVEEFERTMAYSIEHSNFEPDL